jgi:hypothetical protein
MPRRGRPSTDITSRPATPEYRTGHATTFGAQSDNLGKKFVHTRLVIRTDPATGKQTIERISDV